MEKAVLYTCWLSPSSKPILVLFADRLARDRWIETTPSWESMEAITKRPERGQEGNRFEMPFLADKAFSSGLK
jgi:hypothetical protein